MDTTRLRALLARYEAAETSLAEERELRELLARPGLPSEFAAAAAAQRAYGVLAQAALAPPAPGTPPAPWELPEADATRVNGREAALPTRTPGTKLQARRAPARHRRPRLLAAAAVALLLAALALVTYQHIGADDEPPLAQLPLGTDEPAAAAGTVDWSRFEVTDPEQAARITRDALATVSRHLGDGGRITSREVARMRPIHHALNAKS